MKKQMLVASMGIMLGLAATTSAFAADGTVTFTGTITDQACTVDTQNVDVKFGTISSTAFEQGAGAVAAPTAFQIMLSACPSAATGATVRFEGQPDDINPKLLSVGTTGATGVGIALYDAKNAQILPNTDSSSYTLNATGVNTLDFVAKLESTGTVGLGNINTTSNFTVVYP